MSLTVTGPDVDFDDATSVYSILYNMRNSAAEMLIKNNVIKTFLE